jgi:putative SOS response-associated peptidase YedK
MATPNRSAGVSPAVFHSAAGGGLCTSSSPSSSSVSWPQKNPVDGEHTLYGFLTTAPNDVVRPVPSKAMPVILTEPAEFDAWLETDAGTALKLQLPLPADRLRVVALDQREGDGVADAPQGQLALGA